MKKILIVIGLTLTLLLCGCEKENKTTAGMHHVEIVVKDKGTIKLELDANTAPITVNNFINLAKSGFYDNLTFHRIINGFMIQGGGYTVDGTKKNASNIKGEFKNNNIKNDISHKRGVISMARVSGQNNSASSEFFIMHKFTPSLDGDYAAFGIVTDGMDIVDDIAENTPVEDNNGTVKLENRPVIETIKVIN